MRRRKVSNIVLIAAVCAVLGYTLISVIYQIVTGEELSATLTTAWFGFWGAELVALASIKNRKTKYGDNQPKGEEDENDFE